MPTNTLHKMTKKGITISAVMENILVVEQLIDEIFSNHKINDDLYANIMIALTEAVSNAIIHGSQQNPEKKIHLSYTLHNQTLIFEVEDQGNGFNHNELPDPTHPDNIEKENGRGVFLMKHLADTIEYKKQGRIVQLKFLIA